MAFTGNFNLFNPNPVYFLPPPYPFQSPFPNNLFQDFEYFVVLDLEATCDRERNPHPQEIIELASVLVSGVTGKVRECFRRYVRPTCNPLLTEFCKELTGIEQHQVDNGVSLSQALCLHDKWLLQKGLNGTKFAVVTWSNWDCGVMLESECRIKGISKPSYFSRWINLKVGFNQTYGQVRCNLRGAVELAGLAWHGRLHSGLDDATNAARLLSVLMRRGFRLTKSLTTQQENPNLPTPNRHHQFLLPQVRPTAMQDFLYCDCGAKSFINMIRKPGPKYGSFFFGCGNWTPHRGACCNFFQWATS